MKRYNPTEIEPKWQKTWDEQQIYRADLSSHKQKYIAMSMFNYPSGAGIHIGHAMNYTISDVMARFKRQQGYESYHPVGWDAFGLPAENFAIKSGISPQESMAKIIPSYHTQYKAMGWSNDWSKEISTHLPVYYKWTQWIFSEMYRAGLAYQDSRMQWWCIKCQTVLANEQVIDGKCWRHDSVDDPEVAKKEVKQWFFKVTEYADEMLEATDALDWSEVVKAAQKNWIGKSVGAEVQFTLDDGIETKDSLKFTPELTKLILNGDKTSTIRLESKNVSVGEYVNLMTRDGDTVTSFGKAKITQIRTATLATIPNDLEGHEAYASDDEKLADYQRYYGEQVTLDTEFTIYDFAPIRDTLTVFTTRPDTLFGATFLVIAPEHELVEQLVNDGTRDAVMAYVKDSLKKSELERQETKEKTGIATGSYAINPATGAKVPIWVADYVLSGYGTGAIMAVPAHDERDFEFAEKFNLPIIEVVTKPHDVAEQCYHGEGLLMNSGHYDGMASSDAREEIVAWLEQEQRGRAKTTYKVRDWSVSRQRYWGAPIPIIHCEKDGTVLVPDEQLPVELPLLDDFAPSGDGRSALARATEWMNTTCPTCGGPATRETDTLDTYICSSWYYLRYLDGTNESRIFDSAIANKWMPIDFYNGGDHATAHMMYARFITRFFWHQGLVEAPEPFKKFLFNGKVTASDGTMFSKSKGNGVDPLEIINSGYGADSLRTYLMFAAPLDVWARWDPQGVPGTYRFLNRIWNLVQEFLEAGHDDEQNVEVLRTIHPAIRKVTADLEDQKYNTAIAAMMECTNGLYALKAKGFAGGNSWQFALDSLVALVAPFAPHMADELWHDLGHETSAQKDSWPQWDKQYLTGDTMTIIVQVNGKLRAKLDVAKDTAEDEIKKLALADENVKKFVVSEPKKVIYIAGKLVSIVA